MKIQALNLKVKNSRHCLAVLAFIFLLSFSATAQKNKEVKKTSQVEIIGGKKFYIHIVEKEQTLYNISKIYAVTVNDIILENPEAIDGIKPGQSIKIPIPKKENSASSLFTKTDSARYTFHTVEKGQTLYSLSKKYDVHIDTLEAHNSGIKAGLKLGQTIKIPKHKSKTSKKEKPLELRTSVPIVKPLELPAYQQQDTFIYLPKDTYCVALFLPFHLEQTELIDVDKVVNGDAPFPIKSEVALQFYEGVLLALDSLAKQGLSCKVLVYDIDETDSTQLAKILKDDKLKKADLIIGPLYNSNFVNIAKFAKEHNIPSVSPLSQLNKILFDNPHVSKVVPALTTQMEEMAGFIAKKYSNENIILINNPKEIIHVNVIKKVINSTFKNNISAKDTVKIVKDASALSGFLTSAKTNVVILPSNSQADVTELISKLNNHKDRFNIVLFGMPSWRSFNTLDPDYLDTLHLHIPATSFIDYGNPQVISFVKKYRSRFLCDPENYSFQGFDVAMFYLSALKKSGKNFMVQLDKIKESGLQTSFSLYRVAPGSGLDNGFVYILRYQNHQLIKVN